jgi:hypothetical protein
MPSNQTEVTVSENLKLKLTFSEGRSFRDFCQEVRGKLNQAQEEFKDFIKSQATYPRSSIGLWNIHSEARANAIDSLVADIEQKKTHAEVKTVLADFFQNGEGRLNPHSLKTYVMNKFVQAFQKGEQVDLTEREHAALREQVCTELVLSLRAIPRASVVADVDPIAAPPLNKFVPR